jgi:cephalosporin hydroxylase
MKNFKSTFEKYPTTDKYKFGDFYQQFIGHLSPKLLLEIGVLKGDSLRAWKELFPNTRIVGIDIDENVSKISPDLTIFIGDQVDKVFLDSVIGLIGIPDLIIDDGGHTRTQQVTTFRHLFPKLNSGNLYVIEDLETTYMQNYNDSPFSAMQMLISMLTPTNFDGNTLGRQVGDQFDFLYSTMIFEQNICLIKK